MGVWGWGFSQNMSLRVVTRCQGETEALRKGRAGGIKRDEGGEPGQLIIHYGSFHSFSSEAPVALAQSPQCACR